MLLDRFLLVLVDFCPKHVHDVILSRLVIDGLLLGAFLLLGANLLSHAGRFFCPGDNYSTLFRSRFGNNISLLLSNSLSNIVVFKKRL